MDVSEDRKREGGREDSKLLKKAVINSNEPLRFCKRGLFKNFSLVFEI